MSSIRRIFFFVIIPFWTAIFCNGAKIDFSEKIIFSNKVLLRSPVSICVTDHNEIIIPDFKGGDIKIYKGNGELATIIGSKGYGPNEFLTPWISVFRSNTLIVGDIQQRKLFFYARDGKYSFHRTNEVFCNEMGVDIDYVENKIYLSGSKMNEEGHLYSFYSLTIGSENKYDYILPSHVKYGFSSPSEAMNEIFKNRELTAIGVKGMFDINGDCVYYAWEGDSRIIKINLKNNQFISFGKKPKNYIKPFATKKLIESFFSRKGKDVYKERQKMTYLVNIFTTQKHLVVIFSGFNESNKEVNSIFQFYTFSGEYVEELTVPHFNGNSIWFDKKKGLLYSISYDLDEVDGEKFYVAKYSVSD